MSNVVSRRVVAEEVHFDDGGVGIEINGVVHMGMDLADLVYVVENRNVIDEVLERPPASEIDERA